MCIYLSIKLKTICMKANYNNLFVILSEGKHVDFRDYRDLRQSIMETLHNFVYGTDTHRINYYIYVIKRYKYFYYQYAATKIS